MERSEIQGSVISPDSASLHLGYVAEMEAEQRRLAAIMFTDMVGYSALTQQNETLTLDLLGEHNRLLRPLFSQYGGKEIKTTGDGFLVEFASALEAAHCAIAMQKTLHERNASTSAERKLQIRIGLHVGDVVHREADVFGEGVNIAARIEPLAPPEGICLSQQVFDQIQHKIDEPIIKLGKGELKNIQGAMAIYRIVLPGERGWLSLSERVAFSLRRKRTRAVAVVGMLALVLAGVSYLIRERLWQVEEAPTERVALAVLPFQVLNTPEEIGYLGIGIADTLITRLANIGQMRLRPTSAILRYEKQVVDLQEVGRALKTEHVLTGTVQRVGERFRHTEFDWEGTIAESTRALALNPNLELPHYYRLSAFNHLGLLELVDGEVRAGMEINPENRIEPLRLQDVVAIYRGRFAEAAHFLEEVQRLAAEPVAAWFLAQAYYYQGEREQAEAMLAQVRRGGQPDTRAQATLASFLAARGERVRTEELLHAITTGAYMDHHVAYSLGAAYAQLGQHDEALRWLRNAADTGFPCYPWYARDSLLQPLHGDPEFQRFMEELRKSWEAAKARYAP